MDYIIKGFTIITFLMIAITAIMQIKKDCEPSELFSLSVVSILIGLPFGRVWGFW